MSFATQEIDMRIKYAIRDLKKEIALAWAVSSLCYSLGKL